jgi:phosphonate transport system ATP-binding protein
MLQVSNVRVVYPNGHEALKSVTFSAAKGEIVAIVGRSGAGKSTLLRCINGLQRPTNGTIVVDGDIVTNMTNRQLVDLRRHIGFVWQEFNLVYRSTAMRNVLVGRLGYSRNFGSLLGIFPRAEREIALHSLMRVNLTQKARERADRLSGGEKQRVAIARALSQQPKLILADEPVASLDPELAYQVLNDLSRVTREDGLLTLINIHQLDLARAFADRVIGIAQGMIVYDGTPAGLTKEIEDRIYRFDRQPQMNAPSLAIAT